MFPKPLQRFPSPVDIVNVPHDDQGHPRFQDKGAGGPEFKFSALSPHAEQQQVELIPEAGFHDGLAGQGGISIDGNLIDPQLSALASQQVIQKVNSRRPNHLGGHTQRADGVGGDHGGGAGLEQFGFEPAVGHAADDSRRWIEHASGHGDIQVVVVRRQADGDAGGPFYPGGDQVLVVGGITVNMVKALDLARLLDNGVVCVDEYHTGFAGHQLDSQGENRFPRRRRRCSGRTGP